jgi:hypothetical protein
MLVWGWVWAGIIYAHFIILSSTRLTDIYKQFDLTSTTKCQYIEPEH